MIRTEALCKFSKGPPRNQGRRWPQPGGQGGRGVRLPRPQRRRQDDHRAHAHLPDRPQRGPRLGQRPGGGQGRPQIRSQVGILTESPGLYDRLSARRNLEIFAELYGVKDVKGQVEKYLRLLDLWDRRDTEAGTFSKGMKQKLAIARALLHEPPVVFLDEPTSALDPEAAKTVRDFIETLRGQGRTIFLCTHNLDEAERLCERIGVFRQRLIAVDTPDALRRQLFGRQTVVHLAPASTANRAGHGRHRARAALREARRAAAGRRRRRPSWSSAWTIRPAQTRPSCRRWSARARRSSSSTSSSTRWRTSTSA